MCSVECGGGQQFRTRQCEKGSCDGTGKMARACNTHSCKGELENLTTKRLCLNVSGFAPSGEWGCWSDWSPCSVSCGVGTRLRSRKCLSMGDDFNGNGCDGSSVEYDECEQPLCDCKFKYFYLYTTTYLYLYLSLTNSIPWLEQLVLVV